MKQKRLLYNFGVNDTEIPISKLEFGNTAYDRWSQMIRRCYDKDSERNYPTYAGCFVCQEWASFTNYYHWFRENYVPEWQIDKDLLYPGNKVYSPETCLFVPKWLNCFLLNNSASRGEYPVGVCKLGKKYSAFCNNPSTGKQEYIGLYASPNEAHEAWKKIKLLHARDKKSEIDSVDERLYENIIYLIHSYIWT